MIEYTTEDMLSRIGQVAREAEVISYGVEELGWLALNWIDFVNISEQYYALPFEVRESRRVRPNAEMVKATREWFETSEGQEWLQGEYMNNMEKLGLWKPKRKVR